MHLSNYLGFGIVLLGTLVSGSRIQVAFNLEEDFPSHTEYRGPTPTGKEAFAVKSPYGYNHHVYPITGPVSGSKAYIEKVYNASERVIRKWGNLSPWYSVDSFGLDEATPVLPEGCHLDELHYLQRHGARYPTEGTTVANFVEKLYAKDFKATGDLEFLNSWEYGLGTDILTPFGRQQCYTLGSSFRLRYGNLLKKFTHKPVFRTTSQDRMYNTAVNFMAGFFGIPFEDKVDLEVIVEWYGFNNTLNPGDTCMNLYNPKYSRVLEAVSTWREIYLSDAHERLASQIENFKLTLTDTHSLLELCAYETVAFGGSPFCGLFTDEEFNGFEYEFDLGFWYGASFGNPIQAAGGLGWAQEWLSRVTKTRITEFNSTTNSSLHNDKYFPLDQPLYFDFTHDTTLTAILATLNFTQLGASEPLPYDHIPENRAFVVSKISPFATNLQSQVMTCETSGTNSHKHRHKHEHDVEKKRYVRWILNDGVIPIDNIPGCDYNKDGLCELDAFVDALRKNLNSINYEHDCFGDFELGHEPILDGRPH